MLPLPRRGFSRTKLTAEPAIDRKRVNKILRRLDIEPAIITRTITILEVTDGDSITYSATTGEKIIPVEKNLPISTLIEKMFL